MLIVELLDRSKPAKAVGLLTPSHLDGLPKHETDTRLSDCTVTAFGHAARRLWSFLTEASQQKRVGCRSWAIREWREADAAVLATQITASKAIDGRNIKFRDMNHVGLENFHNLQGELLDGSKLAERTGCHGKHKNTQKGGHCRAWQ